MRLGRVSEGNEGEGRGVPEVGSRRPIIILIALVLPAPLGPSRPNTSPRSMARLSAWTATLAELPSYGRGATHGRFSLQGLGLNPARSL